MIMSCEALLYLSTFLLHAKFPSFKGPPRPLHVDHAQCSTQAEPSPSGTGRWFRQLLAISCINTFNIHTTLYTCTATS